MKAKEMLEHALVKVGEGQVKALIQSAIDDLVLLDKHDVAEILDRRPFSVASMANKHNVGIKLRGQRIYTPSDVKLLRGLMVGGGRPKKR